MTILLQKYLFLISDRIFPLSHEKLFSFIMSVKDNPFNAN